MNTEIKNLKKLAVRTALTLLLALTAAVVRADELTSHIDVCKGSVGSVCISGWVFDPYMKSWVLGKEMDVNVIVSTAPNENAPNYEQVRDGDMEYIVRDDVNTAYSLTGKHGFQTKINIFPFLFWDEEAGEELTEKTFYVRIYANVNFGNGYENILLNGPYTAVTVRKNLGEGTEDSPYTICDDGDWNAVIDAMTDTDICSYFSGCAYQLDDYFDNAIPVTRMMGTSDIPFTGTFDGNGQMLFVNLSGSMHVAPFAFTNGATIRNLTVSGLISATQYAGGIVGHGGSGTLTLENCVFAGTIKDFCNFAGGLVGWCDNLNITMDNCLVRCAFRPASGGKYHPIACKNAGSTATATLTNTYYTLSNTPTASGNNLVLHGYGIPVSPNILYGEYETPVTAADGLTYYMATPKDPTLAITEQPQGTLKQYKRSGNAYYPNGTTLIPASQDGYITMVFTNNNKVYMLDPIANLRTDSYIMGTVEGNKITFELPQTIYNSEYGYNLQLAWVNITSADPLTYGTDHSTTTATFTINDKTISLDNSSAIHFLGGVWDDGDMWSGYGDYQSVYTEVVQNGPFMPPAGISPVAYKYTGTTFDFETFEYKHFSTTVNVVKNGNEIYFQGLTACHEDMNILPGAWAKGTIDGTRITIPKGQYLGTYNGSPVYLQGETDTEASDILFTYDAETDYISLNNDMNVNKAPDSGYMYTIFNARIYIPRDPITVPEGVVVENDWNMEGILYSSYSSSEDGDERIYSTTSVAFDGDDIYIKGLSYYYPDSWIKGTISGNVATFACGQFAGENEYYQTFIVGWNGWQTCDIEFTYNKDTKRLSLATYKILLSIGPHSNVRWGYYTQLALYKDNVTPTMVEVPEGLETETYTWFGKKFTSDYYYDDDWNEVYYNIYTDFTKQVNIGIDGDNVYVQGISEELPEAWIKGTLEGNAVIFPTGQFLGTVIGGNWKYDLFFTVWDYYYKKLCNLRVTYDAADKSFTFRPYIQIADNVDPDYIYDPNWSADVSTDNVWLLVNEVAARPSNPVVKNVKLTGTNYPYVDLIITLTDVLGNGMNINKLYYRLYSDIEHHVRQLEFSPDNYKNLDETLKDIPYNFSDHNYILPGGYTVYLNHSNLEDFNRIGVQSVYYGGDVCNTSDIVWYDIKDFAPVATDIVEHSEQNVKSVRYYNAAGMPCDKPTTSGLYIVVKEMDDGTVKTEKRKY